MSSAEQEPTLSIDGLPPRASQSVEASNVDALCKEFSSAWLAKKAPRIEDYLGRLDMSEQPAAFQELIKSEIALLQDHQQTAPLHEYLARFPQYEQSIRSAFSHTKTGETTIDHALAKPLSGLHVRCPHCHNPIELLPDAELATINCTTCGSAFSLTNDDEGATRDVRGMTQIGHFKLVERLGMGGFGAVWKAYDPELDRTVAIKIPRSGQLDKQHQDLFLREARSAAQLRHPNIVPVFEVGRDGETLYIVSEFVRGLVLSDRLTVGALGSHEAATLCAKVADALHHAHEQGVVHRDLKPANVMLDADGEPHLMDFGLARREAHEITMTMEGQVLGTPAYMSPEQAQGDGHNADRRSDIYSLGVMLFQLLTGELPFRGNSRMLIHQVINDEPPSPRKLNATIPRDLETITLKCMEKDPNRRFATADDLATEFRRYLAGEPILARPVGRAVKLIKWVRRNPVPSWSMIAVSLSLSLGVALALWFGILQRKEAERARIAEAATLIQRDAAAKERDKNRQFIDFQSAEYAFKDGDLEEALQRLKAASSFKPHWEYGNFFSRIVAQARQHFSPVLRFQVNEPPVGARLIVPKSEVQLQQRQGWILLIYPTTLKVHALNDGQLVSSLTLSNNVLHEANGLHGTIIDVRLIAPSKGYTEPRMAVITTGDGVVFLSIPDLQVKGRAPTTLRPRLLESSLQASMLAVVEDDVRVHVINSEDGELVATRDFDTIDRIAHCAVSPDGKRIAVNSFSVQYTPTVWSWREGIVVETDSAMQTFSFAGNQNLVGKFNYSTSGQSSSYHLLQVDSGKLISSSSQIRADFSLKSKPKLSGWSTKSAYGVIEVSEALANFGTFRRQSDEAHANAPQLVGGFQVSASSLAPQWSKADANMAAKILDIDLTTFGLVLCVNQFVEVYAPQPSTIGLLGYGSDVPAATESDQSEIIEPVSSNSSSVPSYLFEACHRNNTIWTYAAGGLYAHELQKGGSRAFYYKVDPPSQLLGKQKAIVALAPNEDGSRIWALWEGADTFMHTERSTSKDLVVAVYAIAANNSNTSLKKAGGKDHLEPADLKVPSLVLAKTFRLALHPHGGSRVIRKFFVSNSEQTLVVATTRTTAGYSAVDGELIYKIPSITSFAVSPSQELFAGGDYRKDRSVGVWHADTGKSLFQSSSIGKVMRMAFGSDSRTLHIGWIGDRLEDYELQTGKLLRSVTTNIAPVTMLANGERFVGFLPRSDINGDLVLADINDGRKVSTLLKSCHILTDCVSNQESSLISISIKGEVKILHQFSAKEAESALKLIDLGAMNQWFNLLTKFYDENVGTQKENQEKENMTTIQSDE